MDQLEIVRKTIEQHRLFQRNARIIVALSGGPDSVCLLHLLHRLSQEMELELHAVHVNHQLRGAAADHDEQYAAGICKRLGIPVTVYSYDIQSIAKERCISTEDAGRQMRYQSFFQEKEKWHAQVIAVAHNQNDQAETVLMRLMRGTGIAGLGGMEYRRDDGVVRPVLDLSREQIEEYCREWELDPCIDQTNLESIYIRNRIRLELVPYMQKYFNTNVTAACCRLAAIAREETSLIDDVLSAEMEYCISRQEDGSIYLLLEKVQQMHPALRHRCMQKILLELGLVQNLGFSHLEQADKIILQGADTEDAPYTLKETVNSEISVQRRHSPNNASEYKGEIKTVEFPQGFRMERKGHELRFFKMENTDVKKCASNGVITEKLLKNDGQTDWKTMPWSVRCFDYDKIQHAGLPLLLRTRKPGDYIQPLGMKGTKKLQDYFTDRKISREKRDYIPLVCLGQEVIWVIGGQINENFKVTNLSENILVLEFTGEIW